MVIRLDAGARDVMMALRLCGSLSRLRMHLLPWVLVVLQPIISTK
jgi:hypothetical protein